jgi:adenosylhomocysteine nucleosidase
MSPIAIACAMEWELAHSVRATQARQDGPCTWIAESDGQSLVLAYVGLGMVSAAAGTQALISRHRPRAVLNYGCAGAHRLELMPGDIVVGSRVVAYDNMRESPDGTVRYTGMPYLVDGAQRRVEALEADAELMAAAERVAAASEGIEAWPAHLGWPGGVAHRAPRVVFGTVTSADRWNRTAASIQRLVSQHDSLCEDMEAAAVALVCAANAIPFLTVKDISNNELLRATTGGQAMLDELGAEQLARRAAAFTLAIVRSF